ncbi:MAG: hypothetical protein HYS27_17200 [Deltaproteobacteria bacterium]|nr:hypothetical protein [Deltaproteobacteria bacterium]
MISLLLTVALPVASPAALVLRAGAAPEALGVSRDDESSPEGPGSLAVDADGRTFVLDAVHARVAVLGKGGALEANVPLPSDTVEDIALTPAGDLVALDRLVARRVYVIAPNGSLVTSAPVEGAGVDDGGLVTALFADADGVWLEVLHGAQVRVLDAALREDAARTVRPGMPFGGEYVRLRKVGDLAQVLFFDARGALVADGVVRFSSLLELSGLVAQAGKAAAKQGGELWVAGHELVQQTPGETPTRDAVVVVRLSRAADGRLVERERRERRASPEFVPLKQLVPAGDGKVAHLYVDTRVTRGAAAAEVTSW